MAAAHQWARRFSSESGPACWRGLIRWTPRCTMSDTRPAVSLSLNRLAFSATVHCLTGCAIGEVLGMVIGTALGWGNAATIVLAVILAFFFGYALTMLPLLRSGIALAAAVKLALASDTASIAIMEIVDNL